MYRTSAPRPWLPGLLASACLASTFAEAATLRGLAIIGGTAADGQSDNFTSGLAKNPYGFVKPAGRLTLRVDGAPFANIVTAAVFDADSARSGVIDMQEAWFAWNPVPTSPWRVRTRTGAFFPVGSLEVGYDQVGWNAERTISSAAINSWIADEVRIVGSELTGQWRGALLNVPHTFTARLGVFGANDPAGTGIAWRGWNSGGRVTGLIQKMLLPGLPVYRSDGAIPRQTRDVHVFREIDHRAGLYGSLGYSFEGRLDLEAMHYDNHGDPLRVKDGQYSWHTRFNHLGARLQLPGKWELLSQGMHGSTLMGPDAVHVHFSSWYALASHRLGPGLATVRYDWFQTRDRDILPEDANGERGHTWALAWSVAITPSLRLVSEALRVESTRRARLLISEDPHRTENSLALELRLAF